jgi:Icc-related predicted phosphoesterase
MKIVAISDTHERHRQVSLPAGDVLVHAGDITMKGSLAALEDFADWIREQHFKYKIVIAGNHDFCFENENADAAAKMLADAGVTYLCDSSATFEGIEFWGAPWQPWFHSWAFNLSRGSEIAEKWALIPQTTNVLITHGPPYEIADLTFDGVHAGCEELASRIQDLPKLRAHIFGIFMKVTESRMRAGWPS